MDSRVCDLFLRGSKEWNGTSVQEVFWPNDAEEILKIKLPKRKEDVTAWHYESSRHFFV